MNQDQLRAKSQALFQELVSNWANDLRKEVTGLQDELLQKLAALQGRISKYEEDIDEERILAFVSEATSLMGGGGSGDTLKNVRRSLTKLNDGTSLTEVLTLLLAELSQFAPRVAIFILKGGSCIGWNGTGFDQSPGFNNEGIKRISVPTSANTVFGEVINSRMSFVGESNEQPDNIQLLSRIGNVLPSNIFATPLILRDRIAAVVYADTGDGADQLQDSDALEILTAHASKLLDALSAQKSPMKTGEKLPQPAAAPPATPAPATPAPKKEEESSTASFKSAGVIGSNFGAPAASAAPAPAAPAVSEPDLDSMDSDTRKKHEEAMRFARLLVSEIKLYNEAKVKQGRSNRGIYNLMKEDIERSRQLYTERVPEPVRSRTNYFDDELIRILADGDTSAMGLPAG